jgi:hypothetical protein
MSAEKELHVCIKFCVKLENNGATNSKMLNTAFGDECLSRAHTCEWIKRFKEGRTSFNDDRNPRDRQQAEIKILWHMCVN